MLITTYEKETKVDHTHIKVACQNKELENANSEKLLGMKLDKN